jgi:hypothetical protein
MICSTISFYCFWEPGKKLTSFRFCKFISRIWFKIDYFSWQSLKFYVYHSFMQFIHITFYRNPSLQVWLHMREIHIEFSSLNNTQTQPTLIKIPFQQFSSKFPIRKRKIRYKFQLWPCSEMHAATDREIIIMNAIYQQEFDNLNSTHARTNQHITTQECDTTKRFWKLWK